MPSLALVAACGAALVFGITPVRREPPVVTSAATAAPATSPPASSARHEGSAALATAQAEANAVAAPLAVSPRSPDTDESVPVFDIVRIERTVSHPKYHKQYTVSKRFAAHDPKSEYHVGDRVTIEETRPLSATKRWRVLNKITRL